MANQQNAKTSIEMVDIYWTRATEANDRLHKANEEYRQFAKRQSKVLQNTPLGSAFRMDYIKRNAEDPSYIKFLVKRRSFYQKMAQKYKEFLEQAAKCRFEDNEDREATIARLQFYYEKARWSSAEYDIDIINVEAQRMKAAKSNDPQAFII